ncbi:MAG: GAF domain-containing protein [Armatimonadetes bacterium]|nr:GAF domain-containing protein [Armatimonadota bacterium]
MTDLDAQFLDRDKQVKAVRSLIVRAANLTQVERVLLMLAQHSEGRLVAIDPCGDFQDVDISRIQAPLSQGVSGEVFRTGRSELVADAADDTREDIAMLRKLGARSVLAVPIVYRKRDTEGDIVSETTIGVLHALNKRRGEFDTHDQQILYILGSQASQLIAHTDLYPVAIRDMEQYRYTIESMGVGVAAISAEGRVYEANSEMKVLGIQHQDVGKHYREIFTKGTRFLAEMIDGVFRSKQSAGTEIPIHTDNGAGKEEQRTFRIQVDPIITQASRQGNGFAGVVVVLQDMTVVREEEQMQDSFVSLVSHDLRTPLTVIQGFVDTMLMAIDDGMPFDEEMTKEFLTMVVHQSRRMLRLVNDVLVLARLSKGLALELTLRPYDLKQSVNMVVESQRSINSEFEYVVEAPESLPEVVADQERIEQVVANLLSNAVKYSPEGGTITVRITREGGAVTVAVIDQGVGIPDEALKKMFGRLFRVESDKHKGIKGTGLGLYLCKHLIELHGGHIGVESRYQGDHPEGHGSTFRFTIPMEGPQQNA